LPVKPLSSDGRHFIFNADTSSTSPAFPPQRFTAARHLPHRPQNLYALVADIDSYSRYLPYCLDSTVVARCPRTNAPTEADLRVGWGQFDETFRSKVTCVPEDLAVQADASQNPLFEKLLARWEIRPSAAGTKDCGSHVELHMEFKFTNPLYGALSGTLAPKVASVMIEAFEKRAKEVLGSSVEEKKAMADSL
jgi:coenzyme Q-binding protein COQ10